jgi:hypothetical protein
MFHSQRAPKPRSQSKIKIAVQNQDRSVVQFREDPFNGLICGNLTRLRQIHRDGLQRVDGSCEQRHIALTALNMECVQ